MPLKFKCPCILYNIVNDWNLYLWWNDTLKASVIVDDDGADDAQFVTFFLHFSHIPQRFSFLVSYFKLHHKQQTLNLWLQTLLAKKKKKKWQNDSSCDWKHFNRTLINRHDWLIRWSIYASLHRSISFCYCEALPALTWNCSSTSTFTTTVLTLNETPVRKQTLHKDYM